MKQKLWSFFKQHLSYVAWWLFSEGSMNKGFGEEFKFVEGDWLVFDAELNFVQIKYNDIILEKWIKNPF